MVMNRIREGSAVVRNPFNAGQLGRIPMTPEGSGLHCFLDEGSAAADALSEGNWTNRGYRYYFQFTLTPYGKALEPGLRDKRKLSAPSAAWRNRLEAAGLSGAMILLL